MSSFSDNDDSSMQSSSSDDDGSEMSITLTHAEHKANGNTAYQQKKYRVATGHYSLAIDLAKKELESLLAQNDTTQKDVLATLLASYYGNRAAAFTMLSEHQEALGDCDSAIQVDPKAIKAYFRKAKILFSLGKIDDSLKAYSYGLIHDPNNANGIKERANVQTIQKRFQLAKELLQKDDQHPKKNARQALAQIEIVLTNCPTWGVATLYKIDALVRLQRIDAALALSTELMKQEGYESNNELIFLRAQCLFHQANIEGTMNHLRNILASDPDNTKAFQMVKMVRALKKIKSEADAAYKAREYEQAIVLYGDAIEACPNDNKAFLSKLYLNRALSHNGLRQHEECVADCTRALAAADDEYPKAVLRRAASLLLMGGKQDCERAIRDYELYRDRGWAKSREEQQDLRKKMQNAKVQLKRAGQKDLYKIMGVARDATDAEIKKAYRKMALQHHPDRQKGTPEEKQKSEETFREINLANEILSDPVKRKRYDEGVDEQDIDDPNAGAHHGHGGMGGMDQEMLFEMFMRQQHGRGGFSPFG